MTTSLNPPPTLRFFIINLRTSTARKKRMEEQIEALRATHKAFALNAHFCFFNALTPSDIVDSGFITRYKPFLAGVYKARPVRDRELACFASHYALWQQCVTINEGIFILEDDVDMNEGFIEGVKRIAISPYEYVRLAWSTWHSVYLVEEHFAFVPRLMLGAGGYYISPQGAYKLIQGASKIFTAVDYYMSYSYLHGVAEMLHTPCLVKVNELDSISTIGKPEHEKKHTAFYYRFVLLRECHRIYRDIRMWLFAKCALRAIMKRLS